MCWTKEQLEVLKQFEAEQEAQADQKNKTMILYVSAYEDDLI